MKTPIPIRKPPQVREGTDDFVHGAMVQKDHGALPPKRLPVYLTHKMHKALKRYALEHDTTASAVIVNLLSSLDLDCSKGDTQSEV